MEVLKHILNPSTKEWPLTFLVILLTVLLAIIAKSILTRLYEDRGWKILKKLAPSISHILYIVGFKIASEFAPLNNRLDKWIEGSIYIFAVFVLMRLIEKAALIGIEWSIRQVDNSETLRLGFLPLIRNVITVFTLFSSGIMILNHFNYDAMSLITALGVSSLAVGLAAKDTLSNMISGFILIIDRNLHPGDQIHLAGLFGKVKEIGLRSTQLSLADGNTLIVPNTELVNTRILNLSLPPGEKACTISIRVPFSVPFPKIRNESLLILEKMPSVSKTKARNINLSSLADGYQSVSIAFWVTHLDEISSTTSLFNEHLLLRLQNARFDLVTDPQTQLQSYST